MPSDSPEAPHQGGADRRSGAAQVPQKVHLGGTGGLPHERRTNAEQPQLNQEEQVKQSLVDLNHPTTILCKPQS